jgi:L-ribulose-5-phosphate 4-epimerase
MTEPFKELKQECYEANMQLPKLGLVIYTFGNVSVIDRKKGLFAIKPSGIPYDDLNWKDMVVVDLENNIADGDLRPSSDTKTHTVLYRNFEETGAIVHTHSTYATAWAQAKQSVPVFGTTHADHLACDIPCTGVMNDEKIKEDYETETGFQIIETFHRLDLNPDEIQMALVACHGPFAWGESSSKAVYNSRTLEELCKMALLTRQVNIFTERMKPSLIQKHYERKHGVKAYYGQEIAQ